MASSQLRLSNPTVTVPVILWEVCAHYADVLPLDSAMHVFVTLHVCPLHDSVPHWERLRSRTSLCLIP